MKKLIALAAFSVLLVGCGEKFQEAQKAAEGLKAIAEAGNQMEKNNNEAETFMKERRAKGDTVSMTIDQIKAFLPTQIAGYKPKEEPSVSHADMGEFNYTTAEQTWVSTSGDTNNPAQIKVSVIDWGGTEGGYAMYALPLALKINSEDAHQRTATIKLDIPYTAGWAEYNKDSKEAKVNVVTRYRYFVGAEAQNQPEDVSELLKGVVTEVASRFKDK